MKGVAETAFVIGLLGASPAAHASYPNKSVEMTVLFGGSAQTIAQILAHLMSKQLGKPVVAVNRPGGGGAIGYTYVHDAKPDGYNIVWNSDSISTAHYQGNMPLTYKDFTPIARIGFEAPAIAVNTASGWTSLSDMQRAANKSGKPLKVGISGFGSFTHIVAADLFQRLGLKAIFVPYGSGRAPAELLGRRIDVAVQWPSEFLSEVQAGKLKLLCLTSAKRVSTLPNTPTCAEAGAKGLHMTMWRGLAAPAGTPPAVIYRLEQAAKQVVASPEFKKAGRNLGFEPAFAPSKKFAQEIASDDARIARVMGQLGLKRAKAL